MKKEKIINKYFCRKLKNNDLENVMKWRMYPEVTSFMNTDPVLTIEKQKQWFDKISSSNEFNYWIIEVDNTPCGVISLADVDRINKRCGWSYYVAEKKFRSFHLAISLEMSLYDYVFENLGLNKVISDVFCINKTVIYLHELCGCETEGILKQHIFKNGEYYDIRIQSMLAKKWKSIRGDFDYQRIEFAD